MIVCCRILVSFNIIHRGHQIEWIILTTKGEQDLLADKLVTKMRGDRAADHVDGTTSTEIIESSSFLKKTLYVKIYPHIF